MLHAALVVEASMLDEKKLLQLLRSMPIACLLSL